MIRLITNHDYDKDGCINKFTFHQMIRLITNALKEKITLKQQFTFHQMIRLITRFFLTTLMKFNKNLQINIFILSSFSNNHNSICIIS